MPLYYEPRIVKLTIDEAGAKKAEVAIAEVAKADEEGEEAAENIRIPIEELYGAPERLERVAKFLVEHWEKRREAMEAVKPEGYESPISPPSWPPHPA